MVAVNGELLGTARVWLALESNWDLARELGGAKRDVLPLAVV